MLRIAGHVECTRAEGPYARLAVWVRGCSLRCPGCCNPELFDEGAAGAGTELDLGGAVSRHAVEGITILGGEPLEQIDGVIALAQRAAALKLGVILFSGYTREEAAGLAGFEALWPLLDTLVDGRFDGRRPDRERRFVGSTNQRLHHRTRRYADPALWRGPPRVEVHVDPDGLLRIHGDPARARRIGRAISLTSPRWRPNSGS